jgi:hypothetical protein
MGHSPLRRLPDDRHGDDLDRDGGERAPPAVIQRFATQGLRPPVQIRETMAS